MPTAILAAWACVQVKDCVDAVFCASCDGTIEMPEARFFEYAGVEVVLEVPVVDRYTDAVQSERLEERGIGVREKVFKKLLWADG